MMIRKHLALIIPGILLLVGLSIAQSRAETLASVSTGTSGTSNQVSMASTEPVADTAATAESSPPANSQGTTPPSSKYHRHHYHHHHHHHKVCKLRVWVRGHYNKYEKWVPGHHHCKLWASALPDRYARVAGDSRL